MILLNINPEKKQEYIDYALALSLTEFMKPPMIEFMTPRFK